jgi:hypothetical protein
LSAERRTAFEQAVRKVKGLPLARVGEPGAWSSWLKSKQTQEDLPPIVARGIEELLELGFIFSERRLAACIEFHDEHRLFFVGSLFGRDWSKYVSSSSEQMTIVRARKLVEEVRAARELERKQFEEQKATRIAAARPRSPPPSRSPVNRPVPARVPSVEPARPVLSFAAQELESIRATMARLDARDRLRQAKPQAQPVAAGNETKRAEQGRSAPDSRTPRRELDLGHHGVLLKQAEAVLQSLPEDRESIRQMRRAFMSQISRVEGANRAGVLGEHTRPLDPLRAALVLLEKALGM